MKLAGEHRFESSRADVWRALQNPQMLANALPGVRRLEVDGQLAQALNTAEAGRRDLAAMRAERDGYDQTWHAEVWQNLADRSSKLNDARQLVRGNATLRRRQQDILA